MTLLVARPAQGQVTVFPIQGLTFGQVQPGIPENVVATDAQRRAEFEIRGTGVFQVSLILPSQMTSSGGAALPLSFDSGDGRVRWLRTGITFAFDPTVPSSSWIPFWEGGAQIYLGGRAMPTADQPPGNYAATITLQVVPSGT
jgi:hypothetical protein